MIGIIIVTHSNFAEGIKNSVEMIAGKQDNFTAINFENGEDIEDLKRRTKMSQPVVDKLKNIGAFSSLSETNQISLF